MESGVGIVEKLRLSLNLLQHKYQQYRLSTNETAVIATDCGDVKGLKRRTLYDVPYYSFEGIPYAKPPLGELRFKAPEKSESWQGVRDCFGVKNKATQQNPVMGYVEGSEDCLYLNVYARNLDRSKPCPVMFYIHGGGFVFGEANRSFFGPDYFMEKDVILVTVQYRLGVFGFLNLSSPELKVPGNAGLKDQILGLKWVKNNIANFGGDPNCITVFGESAGAVSTHYLCITEQTRELFQRAILMSGAANAFWANNGHEQCAYTLATLAGYKGEDDEEQVLAYLMKCKPHTLAQLESKVLGIAKPKRKLMFPFAPCIEKYETPQCVLMKTPQEQMRTAWSNTIPIIVGHTSAEGLLMDAIMKPNPGVLNLLKTCRDFVPIELAADEHVDEYAEKLKSLHADSGKLTKEEYREIGAYMLFYFPQHRFVISRLTYAPTAATYLYRFDYDSEVLTHPYRFWRHGRGVKGVGHGDELSYIFAHFLSYRLPKESAEYLTVQRLTGLWAKFAKDGDPKDQEIPGMQAISWKPVKDLQTSYKCLNIGVELQLIDWPELEKVKVWQSLFTSKKELLY